MRTRRRGSFPSARNNGISSLLNSHFARMGYATKIKEHLAPLVWAEMVGPQIAAATDVERVHDGILYVAVRSAMWASELTFYKSDILRRLNDKIGAGPQPIITEIRFQNRGGQKRREVVEVAPLLHPTTDELADIDLSPREVTQIDESLVSLPDANLREKMRRLRLTDARLRTWRLDNGWSACATCGDLAPPRFPYNGTLDCARCRVYRLTRVPLPSYITDPETDEDLSAFPEDFLLTEADD